MAKRPTRASKADAEIVREAQKRHKQCADFESTARSNAKDDLRMSMADAYNQYAWPQAALNARQPRGGVAKPCLTFPLIQQHNQHVINGAQQNQMGVKVNATGFGATSEAADGIEGLIRHIEYQSNAQQNAYYTAIKFQVQIGIGYTHIVADYGPGNTFDQELYIRSIPDPMNVWLDPDCQEPDKSDARWGMIGQDMPRKEFEAKNPGQDVPPSSSDGLDYTRGWSDKDTVRVVRYYRLNETDDTLYAVPEMVMPAPVDEDGKPVVDPMTGAPAVGQHIPAGMMRASDMPDGLEDIAKEQQFQSRPIADAQVEYFVIAGHEILERGETVFDHIPLVPWIGQEDVIEGKFDRWGHTRQLIDAARMYNYSASEFVGLTALQSRAPFMGDARAFEGHEDKWAAANTGSGAFLPYNAVGLDDGVPLPPPQRLDPPTTPTAAMQGMQNAEHQMQIVSGQFDAEMGAPSNERTGVAIMQRQRQGDTATYHFTDRQGAALRLTGKILIGAIPKVYDTQRAIQILGLDGQRKGVVVDPSLPTAHTEVPPPPAPPGQQPDPNAEAIMAINPTIGRYDVEADVGPAYGTRRQEAFNAITQILSSAPGLTDKIGDLLFKSADFPLADEMAKRLAPPSDDPAAAAAQQQIAAMNVHIGQLTQQLKDKQGDLQVKIADQQHEKVRDVMDSEIDRYKAETDRIAAIGSIDPAMLLPLVQQVVRDALAVQMGAPSGSAPAVVPPQDVPTPPPNMAPPSGPIGTPIGTDVQRLPSTNPPGGPIHSPMPTNGAVQ